MARLAKREHDAAWVGGYGARGEFFDTKDRLIKETDEILDRLELLYGLKKPQKPQKPQKP